MANDLAARLKRVADKQTLQLTHQGRKSGRPYQVTIWFIVEGEIIYLVTTDRLRQWPRNVLVRPNVELRIADQAFSGVAEPVTDERGRAHVINLVSQKYWYVRPLLWISAAAAQMGLRPDRSGAFRVRLSAASYSA